MVQRRVANWSPTTIRQTRSVLNRQSPNPGRFSVATHFDGYVAPRHGVPVAAIGRSGGRADSDPGSDVCGKCAQVDGIAGDHDGAGTGSCKGEVGVHDVGGG